MNKIIKISDVIANKDNNFNLIRMLAAIAVIISHSFALSLGDRSLEPIKNFLGVSLGEIAVDIFFITSGLLVTRSLLFRNNLKVFITSRILRIYPALLVSVLFCSLLGGVLSDFSLIKYIQDNELIDFIFYNSTMIFSDAQELPGVFYDAPLDRSVNGSLWTLPWELRMYIVLTGLGVLLALTHKVKLKFNIIPLLIIIIAITSTLLYLTFHFNQYHHWFYVKFCRFLSTFFLGGSIYILKNYIKISWLTFIATASLLLFSFMMSKDVFFIFYILSTPYIVLCIAYLPQGKILKYNNLGDYSYGTYIYAWPIQQTLAISFIAISPYQMMFSAFVLTLLLAILSWHLIEKPTMRLKRYII
jgi:peptidoglycan/LPS O-acetylase OafA/YrhL